MIPDAQSNVLAEYSLEELTVMADQDPDMMITYGLDRVAYLCEMIRAFDMPAALKTELQNELVKCSNILLQEKYIGNT